MASTEEVLKALRNANIATLAATEPEELVIDAETRTITVPSSERLFGVTGDMNIERKYFRCPKIVGDNVDLSTHQIFIAYVYTETESGSIFPSIGVAPYHCEDVEVDGEDITFSWKLTGNVFKNPGFILFKMYAKRTETDPNTVFNTTPAIGTVLATIPDGTEEIVEEYPDVIAQIFDRLDALESGGGGGTGGTKDYEDLNNQPQINGVTLTGNKTSGDLKLQPALNISDKTGSDTSYTQEVKRDASTNKLLVPASGGTVDPEQIEQAVNGYLEENPVSGMTAEQEQQLNQNTTDVADLKSALEQIEGGGWSSTQIDLFEAFTNVIAYTSPDANSIVSSLISSLRSGSSDIPEGSFSIIYVLSNVTSSSKDNSIKSGESYNTTLTASPGYELSSVIVKMGGSDITESAYSDGDITISAVTGNIVITASAVQSSASGQLPQDGLVDYFDFRNKTYTAGSGGLYYINSDFGNGMLYSWSNQSNKQGDNTGIKGAGGTYTSVRATGYPVTDNFPSTRTVCLFGKGGPSVPNSIGVDSTLSNSFLYQIKYISTDKSTKNLPNEHIQYPEGFSENGYNASFVIVNQNTLKIYFDDTLHKTVDGNEIEDFESWDITPLILTSFSNYGTAYAIYNKELSEVEIVEALEFFKTLEVSE